MKPFPDKTPKEQSVCACVLQVRFSCTKDGLEIYTQYAAADDISNEYEATEVNVTEKSKRFHVLVQLIKVSDVAYFDGF